MKRIHILLLLVIGSTSLGCQEEFLERDPYGTIDENTFFTKAEHADFAALACYNKLLYLNGHWAQAQLELGMTGDFSPGGFKDAQSFYLGSFTPNENYLIGGIWKRAYEGIATCNINIEGVNRMSDKIISEEQKNIYLAEMKFIRAFWYFRLIQFYGDVPLKTEVVDNPEDISQVHSPAVSKEEILNTLIVPELLYASEHLPDKGAWTENQSNRLNKAVAFAYLMEVAMYQEHWDEAITYGHQVEGNGYQLIDNPGNVYRVDYEDNSETIFSAAFGPGMESYREFYYGTIESLGEQGRIMRGDTYSGDYFYPSENFIDFFETIDGKSIDEPSSYFDADLPWMYRDPRFDATFFTPMDTITTTTGVELAWDPEWLVNRVTGYDIQKRGVWYGENNWNRRADIHIIRLPKIYLNLAEAYARTGNFSASEEYVEKVRARARNFALQHREKYIPEGMQDSQVLPRKSITSLQDALEAINYESRLEFFTEYAIRYFDLKRWGKLQTEWAETGNFAWEDRLYNLPIPAEELNNNPELQQNHPGWGS
ncbi:MAG: RagB/SusD family nutrient uptake outer membrane protein [Mesonia hippocampi]|uniref:RagB/SusD family nutrient uptake outer membrane protein n=1 Tax=Mesonia hippocampi TaxID=1628250 RepID=UPI003F96D1EF